ncbi:MAG: HIT family protein [Candidatus Aenigmatarchaeota archaeon]
MPQQCPFCQIIQGEQEAEKVYEDEKVVAFLDIRPSARGHTLVVPKKHVSSIGQLPEEMVEGLFLGVRKTIDRLENGLNPDGFNVGWNHGQAAGQAVPHLHVHVLPRYEDDQGGPIQAVVRSEVKEDVSSIAKKIGSGSGEKPNKQRTRMSTEEERKEETMEKKKPEDSEEEDKDEEKEEDESNKSAKLQWKEMKKPKY